MKNSKREGTKQLSRSLDGTKERMQQTVMQLARGKNFGQLVSSMDALGGGWPHEVR